MTWNLNQEVENIYAIEYTVKEIARYFIVLYNLTDDWKSCIFFLYVCT